MEKNCLDKYDLGIKRAPQLDGSDLEPFQPYHRWKVCKENPELKECKDCGLINVNDEPRKVYCRYCKWLEEGECRDDRHCRKEVVVSDGSAYSPAIITELIFNYERQNKNNDCKYYEYKKYE